MTMTRVMARSSPENPRDGRRSEPDVFISPGYMSIDPVVAMERAKETSRAIQDFWNERVRLAKGQRSPR
jgi:hypothetical protein